MPDGVAEQEIVVPDIGDINEVDVIDILVHPGDSVEAEESLITLESDKATMDIPSPIPGTVKRINVSVGDHVKEGSPILTLEQRLSAEDQAPEPVAESTEPEPNLVTEEQPKVESGTPVTEPLSKQSGISPGRAIAFDKPGIKPHASPSVRRFARQLGADLSKIKGSGRKGRILQQDVQDFVKYSLKKADSSFIGNLAFDEGPEIDYSKFGEIDTYELSKIKKLSAAHLHRSWVSIPHVTQHDEADITDLESFRQSLKQESKTQNNRVTMLPFLMKATVAALKTFPTFNASLASSGEHLILKKYFHIGIAVDTEDGLIVPVIRNVDKKGIMELAEELNGVSERARNKKISPNDLQGGSFTISSLGGISGTAFTPIINAPEVAILGVSRAKKTPVYCQGDLAARLILPFSLSYDHRVIDGAEAARFCAYLKALLSDLRRVLL